MRTIYRRTPLHKHHDFTAHTRTLAQFIFAARQNQATDSRQQRFGGVTAALICESADCGCGCSVEPPIGPRYNEPKQAFTGGDFDPTPTRRGFLSKKKNINSKILTQTEGVGSRRRLSLFFVVAHDELQRSLGITIIIIIDAF